MLHVNFSYISNMKNLKKQYLVKGRIRSKYRVEPESEASNINDILN